MSQGYWCCGNGNSLVILGLILSGLMPGRSFTREEEDFYPVETWKTHESRMRETPGLTHYVTFEDLTAEHAASAKAKTENLAAAGSFFEYRSNVPFEIVAGEFPQKKAVRLDKGWFETAGFSDKAFSFEIRFRNNGPGTLSGNSGSKNGTILGMGDGYWSGTRVTTDFSNQRLHFAIGRPQPSGAVGIETREPAYHGLWNHLAVTWDGRQMRIYLNGILENVGDYRGDFVPPNWGLRIGYNDAGVGSVNMDVEEAAVFNRALAPDEVFAHAVFAERLTGDAQKAFLELTGLLLQHPDEFTADEMNEILNRIRKEKDLSLRELETLVFVLVKSGFNAFRYDSLVPYPDDCTDSLKHRVLRRLVPDTSQVPVIHAAADTYRMMLKELALSPEEKERGEKAASLAEKLDSLLETKRETENSGEAVRFPPPVPHEIFEPGFAPAIRFYVAVDGNTSNNGTEFSPFASLSQARDAIRKLREKGGGRLPRGGVEVIIRGGLYPVRETVTFNAGDSGTVDAPIVYRNFAGETPVFCGGVNLKKTAGGKPVFQKVTDTEILASLRDEVQEHLMVADLKSLGIHDKIVPIGERGFGKSGPSAAPWFNVYVNGKPQQIARYPNYNAEHPNDCFLKTGKVTDGNGTPFNSNSLSAKANPGVFEYHDERVSRFANQKDVWLFGYWMHLWAANSHQAAKINTEKKQITTASPDGYGFREGMPFYVFNLLSEMDAPGEWYFDRGTNRLYILPPLEENGQPMDLNAAEVELPIFADSAVQCQNLSHVTFFGLTMTDFAGTPFQADGGDRLLVAGCTFERIGCWAVSMTGGKRNGVYGCDMRQLGGGGVHLSGGNPKTLECGDCFVENCTVQHFTIVDRVYAPAVSMDGVGNRIAHNRFEDSPHHGIRMGGYDHKVEYNRINRVVQESDDQSGLDMWGDPLCRGNGIRYNYWSNIGNKWDVAGQAGIRLDDMISGVQMFGNIFVRCSGGHFGAVQIHGGKDNVAENNLIVDSSAAFSFSPWGEKRWLENLRPESPFWRRSSIDAGIDPAKPPHSERYPDLAELPKNADRNFIRHNIAFVTKTFARNDRGQNNMQGNVAFDMQLAACVESDHWPRLTSEDGTEMSLPPNNSRFYEIFDFQPLPYDNMGNYPDNRLPNRQK
ncbi:MAG: right-handed parallel beta-helix repeat-containing protein [Planctomycetaceae bacterium]|nr:right-handed parallel beta-helix repeat-containing protein [Planctomycetaceae bacterium]